MAFLAFTEKVTSPLPSPLGLAVFAPVIFVVISIAVGFS